MKSLVQDLYTNTTALEAFKIHCLFLRHLPKKMENKSTKTKETQKILHVSSAIVLVAVIKENFIEEVALALGPEVAKKEEDISGH